MYTDQLVEDSQITNISISNCAFVKSVMILKNIHLTIKDSKYFDCDNSLLKYSDCCGASLVEQYLLCILK